MHAGKGDSCASPALCMRLLFRLPGLAEVGSYRLHCSAADATLLGEVDGDVLGALAVDLPVLLLTDLALVVLAEQGLGVAAVLHLDGKTSTCMTESCPHAMSNGDVRHACLRMLVKIKLLEAHHEHYFVEGCCMQVKFLRSLISQVPPCRCSAISCACTQSAVSAALFWESLRDDFQCSSVCRPASHTAWG